MLHKRLRELRTNRKLKQADVASFLQVSTQAYNFYETNKREPDNETLQKLASFFCVTVDYLLGRSDDRTSIKTSLDLPDDVQVLMRNVSKLTDKQKEIIKKLVQEFIDEE